jgi:hypothetical protein
LDPLPFRRSAQGKLIENFAGDQRITAGPTSLQCVVRENGKLSPTFNDISLHHILGSRIKLTRDERQVKYYSDRTERRRALISLLPQFIAVPE